MIPQPRDAPSHPRRDILQERVARRNRQEEFEERRQILNA
jgi:hypothetical protein